jgi:hypothetical protein
VNDLIVRSDKNGTHGPDLGKVEAVRLGNNCIDSETIKQDSLGVSYGHNVWGGGNTNNPQYTEDGSAFPQPGILVTQDSAFTGEITGLTIAAVNQTALSGGLNVVELTEVTSTGTICHPGDSGGPWIQHEGSTNNVKIVGTTAGSPNPSTCTTVFYEQIGGINSHFGTHVPS